MPEIDNRGRRINHLAIDFRFPVGLFWRDGEGGVKSQVVAAIYEYRRTDATPLTPSRS